MVLRTRTTLSTRGLAPSASTRRPKERATIQNMKLENRGKYNHDELELVNNVPHEDEPRVHDVSPLLSVHVPVPVPVPVPVYSGAVTFPPFPIRAGLLERCRLRADYALFSHGTSLCTRIHIACWR